MMVPEGGPKGGYRARLANKVIHLIQLVHCDVHKKLCKIRTSVYLYHLKKSRQSCVLASENYWEPLP